MILNPKVDIAFKKIFAAPENKDLLKSLINAIVKKEDQVEDLKLMNPQKIQRNFRDKLVVLDIKAKDKEGRIFNIEMQMANHRNHEERMLEYWAENYSNQLSNGENYSKLKKVIGIHILNFKKYPKEEDFHTKFKAKSEKTGKTYFNHFEIHTLELPKFEEGDYFKKMTKAVEVWGGFLTNWQRMEKLNLNSLPEGKLVKKAIGELEAMRMSPLEKEVYKTNRRWMMDEATAIKEKGDDVRAEMQKEVDQANKAKETARKSEQTARKSEQTARKSEQTARKSEQTARKSEAAALKGKKELEAKIRKLQEQISGKQNIKDAATAVGPKQDKEKELTSKD